jgi:hypothetical protein
VLNTPVVVLAALLLVTGCGRHADGVLLRYAPQVGATYRYQLQINRPHDPIVVTGDMQVVGRGENGYQVRISGMYPDALFSEPMTVTERHNTSHPGYISLNFPDDPVRSGGEWSGDIPWYFESDYVLDPGEIHLPASYRLLGMGDGEHGRCAIVEQRVEADAAADGLLLHVGQVGVRWDQDGRITALHQDYDAFGKLRVGDVVVGINGQRAEHAGDLTWLAEKHIQRPRGSRIVRFAVLRDGKPREVAVERSIDELALVQVHDVRSTLTGTYDVNRSVLLEAEAHINQQDIAFTSPTAGPFPVVDDYGGFHKFGYLRGRTAYQARHGSDGVAWTLTLVE